MKIKNKIESMVKFINKRNQNKVPTDLNYKLSEHFTLGEMIRSQTATRSGIDNTPNWNQFRSLQSLCINVLEPVRELYSKPIISSSGLRVPRLNLMIGGSKYSQHKKGEACDFIQFDVFCRVINY